MDHTPDCTSKAARLGAVLNDTSVIVGSNQALKVSIFRPDTAIAAASSRYIVLVFETMLPKSTAYTGRVHFPSLRYR